MTLCKVSVHTKYYIKLCIIILDVYREHSSFNLTKDIFMNDYYM